MMGTATGFLLRPAYWPQHGRIVDCCAPLANAGLGFQKLLAADWKKGWNFDVSIGTGNASVFGDAHRLSLTAYMFSNGIPYRCLN